MEKVGDVFAFLPDKTKERARDVVAKWAGDWETLGKKYRDMMPQAEIRKADLFWHSHLIGEVERRAQTCSRCDTTRWVYMASEDAPDHQRSCKVPLVPVLRRTGYKVQEGVDLGRLELSYLHCSIYREWALKMESENARRNAATKKPSYQRRGR